MAVIHFMATPLNHAPQALRKCLINGIEVAARQYACVVCVLAAAILLVYQDNECIESSCIATLIHVFTNSFNGCSEQ